MKENAKTARVSTHEPSSTTPPFRFWMTGCMAVVMSAFAGTSQARTDTRGQVSHLSRFSVAETVQRIEASAQRHGLQMFALVDRKGVATAAGALDGADWKVIVLASSEGGTPVLMDWPGARPAVPMSLVVRETAAGGSEVLVGNHGSHAGLDDLPSHVKRDLAELPGVVVDALR